MAYTCAVDTTCGFVQLQLPKAYWDWRAKAPMSTASEMSTSARMAGLLTPMHPSFQPPEPGRRVFAIHDGGGEGNGVPCGQLSLIPS